MAAAVACGDGVLSQGEECDDANTSDNDGCSGTCILEEFFIIQEIIPPQKFCGDGSISLGEQCDWGIKNSDTSPDSCRSNCMAPRCGDSIVDSTEECDEGTSSATITCNAGCRKPLVIEAKVREKACGNGFFEPPEECDAGESNSYKSGATCRPGCIAPKCGDGIKDPLEECDDRNSVDGDGCSAICIIEVDEPVRERPTIVAGEIQNVQFPQMPFMMQPPMQLPLAQLQPLIAPQGVAGETGPAAVAVIGAGAAGGWSWMRRKKRK